MTQTKYFVFVFLFSIFTFNQAKKVYPWGGGDVNERSEDILEALRKNLKLETFQDSISKVFKSNSNNGLHMKNDEGVSFVAKLKPEMEKVVKDTVEEVGHVIYNVNTLDAHLRSSCAVMSIDYWNYEWCHRRHVSQFHLEQQGNGFAKAPEWSLGKYSRSVFVRENDADIHNETVPITKVIDYFIGGQHCDENNSSRSTEVHLQCCEGHAIQNYIPTDVYYAQSKRNTGPPMPKATMNVLEEPATCAYKAVVCTPLLCKPNKPVTPLVTGGSALTNVMLSLNNSCLMRQEDWWTYELCFTKGVRQLRINVEQSVLPDGSVEQKKVVVNQYILGNPLLDEYANETALADRVKSHHAASSSPQRAAVPLKEAQIIASSGLVSPMFHTRGKEPKHLELEFTNGTACDIDNVNRSIIVELYCGLTNSILSTWEDSTCHYRMKAELTILCTLPDFVPKKDNVSTIDIIPLFNLQEDAEDERDEENVITSSTTTSTTTATTTTTATSLTGTPPSELPLELQREMEALSRQLLMEQQQQEQQYQQFEVIPQDEKEEETVQHNENDNWLKEVMASIEANNAEKSTQFSAKSDVPATPVEVLSTADNLATITTLSSGAVITTTTTLDETPTDTTTPVSEMTVDVTSVLFVKEYRVDPLTGEATEVDANEKSEKKYEGQPQQQQDGEDNSGSEQQR